MDMWWNSPVSKDHPTAARGTVLDPTIYPLPQDTDHERLPVIQNDFRSTATVGTARYSTMRSLYRGKDEARKRTKSLEKVTEPQEDYKELLSPVVSDLTIDRHSRRKTKDLPTGSPSYIATYKAMLKMKGLELDEMFQGNRHKDATTADHKPDRNKRNMSEMIRKKKRLQNRKRKRELKLKLPDIHEKNEVPTDYYDDTETGSSITGKSLNTDSYLYSINGSSVGDLTCRSEPADSLNLESSRVDGTDLDSNIVGLVEDYADTPGQRQKARQHNGRKLGNIVSSHRLNQLLDGESPLKMEHFYNYYP